MANLGQLIPALFVGPNGQQLTQDQIRERQSLAQDLLAQASDTSPNAGGVASILAKGLTGLRAGMERNAANNALQANASTNQSLIAGLLGGLGGGGTGQAATVATPTVAPMQNVSPAGGSTVSSLTSAGIDPVSEVVAAAPSNGPSTAASAAKGADVSFSGKAPYEIASSLIGKGEVPDRSTLMEFFKNGGQNLDPATTAWCAAFVNSSLGAAGMQGTGKLNARSFLDWGTPVDQPQKGDIAVFSRGNNPNGWQGHVGFFDSTNPDGTINVLGGNQSNGVSIAPYAADRLLGYRRPSVGGNSAPAASQPAGISPAIIAALSSPVANEQTRSVAGMLLNNQFSQQEEARKQALAQQQQRQAIAQRQSIAQSMGINPSVALDENAWKSALDAANRGRQTATVNGVVLDVNTGQPIFQAPQQPTTGMQDYNFYAESERQAGRQPLGPLEYEQALRSAGASRTNIDTGTVPQGYQAVRDDQGRLVRYDPVPGGPADTSKTQAKAAVNTQRSGNIVLEDVDRAVNAIESNPALTTGIIGNWSRGIGGTPANKVQNLLQTVRANSAFDRLQQMREASPTGGALGAVSDSELGLLQNAIGSLEQSNDSEDLVYNLRRVQRIYEDIINGPEAAAKMREERSKAGESASQPAQGWKDLGNGVKIRPKGSN